MSAMCTGANERDGRLPPGSAPPWESAAGRGGGRTRNAQRSASTANPSSSFPDPRAAAEEDLVYYSGLALGLSGGGRSPGVMGTAARKWILASFGAGGDIRAADAWDGSSETQVCRQSHAPVSGSEVCGPSLLVSACAEID